MKPASTVLRELLARDEILVLPGVYDGISARIALSEGFDALYMTGECPLSSHLISSADCPSFWMARRRRHIRFGARAA